MIARGTLTVETSAGIFSTERIVRFSTASHETRLIADTRDLIEGRLVVEVLWAALDKALIRLPSAPFIGTERTFVSLEQLHLELTTGQATVGGRA